MLPAQVEYWKLRENQRHNVVSEVLGFETLAETKQHNRQTEALGWSELGERVRHDKATENISTQSNYINWINATTRQQELAETGRHNRVGESISWYQSESQRIGANAAMSQAGAAWQNASIREGELEQTRVRDENNYNVGKVNAKTSRIQANTEKYKAETSRISAESQAERNAAEIEYGAYKTYVTETGNMGSNIIKGIGSIIPF